MDINFIFLLKNKILAKISHTDANGDVATIIVCSQPDNSCGLHVMRQEITADLKKNGKIFGLIADEPSILHLKTPYYFKVFSLFFTIPNFDNTQN